VDLGNVDPVYYERSYWLSADGEGAQRAYRLLVTAMEDENRVGIGTVVIRNKQYLAAIRPLDGALVLSTMRFADEVVARSEIDGLPGRRAKPDSKELKLAVQIIDALSTRWDPRRYHDTYTEELKTLIEQKAKGKEVTVEEPAPSEARVVDLLEALEASLPGTKSGGKRTGNGRTRKGSTVKMASAAKKGRSHGRRLAPRKSA
jgi:DNA end-binding protein Ku